MKITIKRAQSPSLLEVLPNESNLRVANNTIKRATFIMLLLLPVIMNTGCNENVALEYTDDPSLYFLYDTRGQRDSLSQTFFLLNSNVLRDTVYIVVNAMGRVSSQYRPVQLVQTNIGATNAAVAGVHYVPFDDPDIKSRFAIPAGKSSVSVPIILLRDESLELEEFRLALTIGENEYFGRGISTWQDFVVKTTAQAVKPNTWDIKTGWNVWFGASWGSVKMKFIIDATGYTDWETVPSDKSYKEYLKAKVLLKFAEYNAANPNDPLKEADGTVVSFTS